MVTSRSLPFELWLLIYENVGSIKQLKQCRLVCKDWDYPTESAMMTNPIKISSAASALILYNRLNINHARCSLIKKLYIDCEQEDMPAITKLLTLAFTSRMEELRGFIAGDNFYLTMIEIAQRSPRKFTKLKIIPKYLFDHSPKQVYLDTLYAFKDNLQSM